MDNELQRRLSEHKSSLHGLEHAGRYAVTIPLLKKDGKQHVLFEVRANLAAQPGDICLPGGRIEEGETPLEAALRETQEELLVSMDNLNIVGESDTLFTGNLFLYPYIVTLSGYTGTFNEEVQEVFCVPLDFFLHTRPETWYVKKTSVPPEDFPFDRIHGGRDYKWRSQKSPIYFYQWEDHTIWGITAKVMKDFADILL